MSQLPRALGRLLPGWQAGGAGRGGARGAWAAGTGRAQGRGVTEPPPATPARPAGADSLVSPGLSNCLAVQAPCPETAAGTGRGGVWWAGLPVRSPMEPRSQALEQNSGLGRWGRQPARPLVRPPRPRDCALPPDCLSAGLRAAAGRRARLSPRPEQEEQGVGPCGPGRTGAAGLGLASSTLTRRRGWRGGGTSLSLEARTRRQGRSRMVAADLCPKSHGLPTGVGRARVQRAGRGLKTQRSRKTTGS